VGFLFVFSKNSTRACVYVCVILEVSHGASHCNEFVLTKYRADAAKLHTRLKIRFRCMSRGYYECLGLTKDTHFCNSVTRYLRICANKPELVSGVAGVGVTVIVYTSAIATQLHSGQGTVSP